MIKIQILVAKGHVVDEFEDKECTLNEVSIALLRLKQIEQELIDKEFKNKFEMEQE